MLFTMKMIFNFVHSPYAQLPNAIHSVKDSEWQRGRCTVTFSRGPLQHLMICEVTMLSSLSECANFMKKIASGLTVKGDITHCIVFTV